VRSFPFLVSGFVAEKAPKAMFLHSPEALEQDSKLIIVSLEGCHGCGKTSLCEEFEAQGFRILDEAFMDMPSYALHPQSLLMETSWVCSWFERVLRLADRHRNDKNLKNRKQVYIADRSPFSAVFYSNNGHLLEPLIREQMKEVQQFSNVQFYTIHVEVEQELLWNRILKRLERQPERVRFNEHKRSWMDQTLEFYTTFEWDLRVENGHQSISAVVDEMVHLLSEKDDVFRQVAHRKKSSFASSFSSSYDTSVASSLASVSSASSDSECESVSSNLVLSPIQQRSIIAFNNSLDLEDEPLLA
jgi:thymidylate kinase